MDGLVSIAGSESPALRRGLKNVIRPLVNTAYVLDLGVWIVTGVVAGFLPLDTRWSQAQRVVAFDVFMMCAGGATGYALGRLRSTARR